MVLKLNSALTVIGGGGGPRVLLGTVAWPGRQLWLRHARLACHSLGPNTQIKPQIQHLPTTEPFSAFRCPSVTQIPILKTIPELTNLRAPSDSLYFVFYLFLRLGLGTAYYVAQAGPSQPSDCWDFGCVSPHWVYLNHNISPFLNQCRNLCHPQVLLRGLGMWLSSTVCA